MLEHILGDLSLLIAVHGLWIVALMVGLESMGLPLPGETILVAAAIYAGATGTLSVCGVVAAATAGAVTGDSVAFWIGRTVGQRALIRHGPHLGLTTDKIKLGRYLFLRFGGPVVFFGRFVAVLRVLTALLAGTNRMPWPKFILFNAAGGATWAATVGWAAYVLGTRIHDFTGPAGLVFLLVAAGLLVWLAMLVRKHEAQLQAQAEAAMPGPIAPV